MALRIFDRVKQVTSSTGTGNITLGGTPNGFQSFSDVFSSGDTTYICIENGVNWEVSRATYGVAGSGTLSRDTILDSSTGAAINLSGRSTVFCTVPAAKYAYLDPSGEINLSLGGLSDATITSPATGNILSYNGSQWVNSVPDPGYSDEQAQDAIGGILGSGTDIVLSYNDSTPAITGALTNTTVTPGSYTLSSITVDQKGRITAASSGSVDLSSYLTSATAASTYVPYTGATSGLNLGAYALSCGAITTSSDIVLTGSANGIYLNPANVNKGLIYFSAGQNRLNGISSVPWVVESDAGFKVRNSANSADAALTCGAITASSLLSLQNSTTPMEFNLHNTYTSATSREYLKMLAVTGGAYQIGSAIGSAGGTNRAITFGHWNAGGSFTSSLSIDTTANQVQIGTIKAGYNTSFSTGVYGINLNNGSPNCTIWSGDSSAFGSSFSGYNVFMVGHDVGTLSGFGIGSYPKFVYSNGSTLSIPQICVGNPSGFSGLDLALGTTGTPTDGEYTVTSGYGTNKAGASMWLMAGRSTGSGAGGSVYIGTSNTGSSGTTRNTNLTLAQFNSTAITFSRDLLFTDATYDIGKSGATRPRDGFFSRDITFGQKMYIGTFPNYITTTGGSVTVHSNNGVGNSASFTFDVVGSFSMTGPVVCNGVTMGGSVAILSRAGSGEITWSNNGPADLTITPTSNILNQRNSTSAQTFCVYNTYTSSTSGEMGELRWASNVLYIGSNKGSAGGSARNVAITHGGTVVANFLSDRFYLGPIADSTATGGNARGAGSVDFQIARGSANQVASGTSSMVLGGTSNKATSDQCATLAGTANTASGQRAVTLGGYGCTASHQHAIAGGYQSTASGQSSVSFGYNSLASGQYTYAMGVFATASGNYSYSFGYNTTSSASHAFSTGFESIANKHGQRSHGAGKFASQGDAQYVRYVARIKTTDNTPTTLMLDGSTSRLTITSGKILFCDVFVSGIKSDGSAAACYKRKVAIKNVGGTTTLVGAVEAIGTDTEDSVGCDIIITADNTNDALDISVTGIAAETWRWVAVIEGIEVAYGT